MEFAWDPRKSEACDRARGFDFGFAARIFLGRTVVRPDQRVDYGEHRWVAVGAVDGAVLTVVFTDRSGATGETQRRIISARRSNHRERQAYWQAAEDSAAPSDH